MSIAINSNFERDQLTASSTGQTVFNFSFPIADETYLTVYQRGENETPDDTTQQLTLGDDYTVTGAGEEAGGYITLVVGATEGDIITLVGTEPIDRESVFDDLNPFTTALNQQLNELTIMVQQVYTYWNHLTPRYNFDELISNEVRPLKRILPMLPEGHVWVGRGAYGETPDDIVTAFLGEAGMGNVIADHEGMRPSIAIWTGTDFILNDSDLNISGSLIVPSTGAVSDVAGFSNGWAAVHIPAHSTAGRPASPSNGDIYADTDDGNFYGYLNGQWLAFVQGDVESVSVIIEQDPTTVTAGHFVRVNSLGVFVDAQADSRENAEVAGLVLGTVDPTHFRLLLSGMIPDGLLTGMTPGQIQFLSPTVAGTHTETEPTTDGFINLPLVLAHSATTGQLRYSRGKIIGGSSEGGNPTGGNGSSTFTVNQPGHGFDDGDWIRVDSENTYAYSQADTLANAQTVGVIIWHDINNFTVQQVGYNTGSVTQDENADPLVPGVMYYISATSPGQLTATKPVTLGYSTKPVYMPVSAVDFTGWVYPQRPLENVSSSSTNVVSVNQPGHPFLPADIGKALRVDSEDVYALAQSDSATNTLAVGILIAITDADNFVLQTEGISDIFTGLTPAAQYFLSSSTPGVLTTTEPTTAGTYSKPMAIAVNPTTAYIQEQRPLPAASFLPGASPLIFLGYLDQSNSWSDTTILQDSSGGTFESYQLFVEYGATSAGGGITGLSGSNITIGLQLYIGGAWITSGYNAIMGGVYAPAGTTGLATPYGLGLLGASQNSLVIYGAFSRNPSIAWGTIHYNNQSGTHSIDYNCYCQDLYTLPSNIGYTCVGSAGRQLAGTATGMRVALSGGALVPGLLGYIAVYGVPRG